MTEPKLALTAKQRPVDTLWMVAEHLLVYPGTPPALRTLLVTALRKYDPNYHPYEAWWIVSIYTTRGTVVEQMIRLADFGTRELRMQIATALAGGAHIVPFLVPDDLPEAHLFTDSRDANGRRAGYIEQEAWGRLPAPLAELLRDPKGGEG